jgi:L-malate glycosyltransferase
MTKPTTSLPSAAAAPTKILFCIDTLIRGGTELQLIGLIERLDPALYKPYLLTLRPSDPALTPKNCTHLAWQVPKLLAPAGLKSLCQLAGFLRREKIDIVQCFFQDSTLFGGLAATLARTPVRIACFRDLGFWLSRKQAILLKQIYKRMTAYICNAEIVGRHFEQTFGLEPSKMQLLRNGIEVAQLPFIEHPNPSQHIGIVGNMTRQVKRTDLFIKAAARVAPQHPHIRWHIIGDGDMRPQLEQLAQTLGVLDKLVFAGRVADVAGYLEQLDIGVICSDSEGLSNALLEYQFKGVAAVATHVGGNPELITHQQTGLLVPPDNEQALAAALQQLIENNDLKITLAKAARTKAESEYSWQKALAAHHGFYQQQLANS